MSRRISLSFFVIAFLFSALRPSSSKAGEEKEPLLLRFTFLLHDSVQKELKLTPEQIKEVTELNDEVTRSMREMYGEAMTKLTATNGNLGDRKTQIERAKLAQKQIDSSEKAVRDSAPRVAEILTKDQAKRFREILVQFHGLEHRDVHLALGFSKSQSKEAHDIYQAMLNTYTERIKIARGTKYVFPNDEVLKVLNLTPEQHHAMNKLRGKANDEMKPIDTVALFEEMKQEVRKKITALMTDEQKAKFEELQGKPFDIPEMRPRSSSVQRQ